MKKLLLGLFVLCAGSSAVLADNFPYATVDINNPYVMPIYRLIKNMNGFGRQDHMLSFNPDDGGYSGYKIEGVAFRLYNTMAPDGNMRPLYRCTLNNDTHAASLSETCKDIPLLDVNGAEGKLGYLSTIQREGSRPVYRYYNSVQQTYLVTVSPQEATQNWGEKTLLGYSAP